MNTNDRRKSAEDLIMSTRAKHCELPEPELTYAVEMALASEVIRLQEEIAEQRYIRRYE